MPGPKTALVTGGARRVGKAVVTRLHRAGYDVVFTYESSAAEAQTLTESLTHAGMANRVRAMPLDLANFNQVRGFARLIQRYVLMTRRLDLLVNCAARFEPDRTGVKLIEQLQRLYRINAAAPTLLIEGFAAGLSASGGSVVNLIDLLAERPWPKYSAYCASKAALHSLTLSYARKLAPQVRVNGIAPGVIDWPDDMPESDRAAYLRKVPLGRAGTPEDAAELVLQLAEAMPYVTGQVIRLDGGRSLV